MTSYIAKLLFDYQYVLSVCCKILSTIHPCEENLAVRPVELVSGIVFELGWNELSLEAQGSSSRRSDFGL